MTDDAEKIDHVEELPSLLHLEFASSPFILFIIIRTCHGDARKELALGF